MNRLVLALFAPLVLAGAGVLHAAPGQAFPAAAKRRGQTAPADGPLTQASRTSANYSLVAENLDAGGAAVLSSASYTVKGASAGTVGTPAASANHTAKGGYAGQLYETRGLGIGADAASVNEGATIQLRASPRLDDGTLLAALSSGVDWSVDGGPVVSVSSGGLATAGTVYQNTPATVRASSGGLTGTGILIVRNVNTDDFGAYANDGIDDAWQTAYFGLDNPRATPDADADGTGQTNLFKYLAGLDPLDANSRFVLSIRPTGGQPTQKTLSFSPVYSGRTYTVQSTPSLAQPVWAELTNSTISGDGTTRTVTDLDAGASPRFYRVLIGLP